MPNNSITPHNPLEGDRPELSINLHDGSEEQISIIVVHKDRPEYLNICLQSIACNSNNNNYEIIVVDNASGKPTQDLLDDIERDGVKVRRLQKNVFWSEACNQGVSIANKNSKYFVFMHCDTVVLSPGWLDVLIHVSEAKKAGLVGISTSSYSLSSQKVEFIEEWLMLMTKQCFNAIGPWPEQLPAIGHSFVMTLRAQFKGWNPQVMKNNIAHHYRIMSLDVNDYERLTEQATITLPKMIQDAQSRPVGR